MGEEAAGSTAFKNSITPMNILIFCNFSFNYSQMTVKIWVEVHAFAERIGIRKYA